MSKNKRHLREMSSAAVSLGLSKADDLGAADQTIHTNQPSHSGDLSRTGKAGLWSYVKQPSHWWVIGLIALLTVGALGAGLK